MTEVAARLRTLNWGAFGLHVALLVALVVFYFVQYPRTSVQLLTPATTPLPADGRRDSSGLAAATCPESCTCWPSESLRNDDLSIDLFGMTVAFSAITVFAHLVYATDCFGSGWYVEFVCQRNCNPLRWVEYSITASLMSTILAVLAGLRIRNSVITIFLVTFLQMIQGYMVESALAAGRLQETVAPLVVGWVALVTVWFSIYDAWYTGLQEADDQAQECRRICAAASGGGGEDGTNTGPPSGLIHLISIVFVLFASFGVLNLVQVGIQATGRRAAFHRFETVYIILSFVAKALLIIWSLASIFGGDLIWLQACGAADSCACIPFA